MFKATVNSSLLLLSIFSLACGQLQVVNITKCFGLGLENLTPADLADINATASLRPNDPNIGRNTTQLIQAAGYPAEQHTVTTSDGYILNLFRIPYGKNEAGPTAGRRAVFIQHGLLATSDMFLLNYPDKNLPYILVDQGFDVWLGNSRGTKYSSGHTTLDPNETLSKYWDFSWHEMGIYDIPAVIDYILTLTNLPKITYIGHSQGTTQAFAGLSLLPSLNSKINLFVAMAPPVFMNDTYSAIRALALLSQPGVTDDVISAYGSDGRGRALPNGGVNLFSRFASYGCTNPLTTDVVCNTITFLIMGYDYYQAQNELMPALVNHFPDTSSMKCVMHHAQLINSGRFRKFDYGAPTIINPLLGFLKTVLGVLNSIGFQIIALLPPPPQWLENYVAGGNMAVYGTGSPPQYNLSAITVPIVLYAGPNDALATESGVIQLAPQLPSNIDLASSPPYRRVNFSCLNHGDFCAIARDVNPLLYNDVLSVISLYSS